MRKDEINPDLSAQWKPPRPYRARYRGNKIILIADASDRQISDMLRVLYGGMDRGLRQ